MSTKVKALNVLNSLFNRKAVSRIAVAPVEEDIPDTGADTDTLDVERMTSHSTDFHAISKDLSERIKLSLSLIHI